MMAVGARALTQKPIEMPTKVVKMTITRKRRKRSYSGFSPALQYTIVE
jgi:hypothetical protein